MTRKWEPWEDNFTFTARIKAGDVVFKAPAPYDVGYKILQNIEQNFFEQTPYAVKDYLERAANSEFVTFHYGGTPPPPPPPPKVTVAIKENLRPLSTYICGNPGSGKSSLLQKMILQDIGKGRPVCVIDPTSQLIKVVLSHIPAARKDDIVYFDTSMGLPIDFFSYREDDEDERQELIEDISNIIDISDAKIARHYIRKVLKALFEANRQGIADPCTVFDILSFIQNEKRKKEILAKCPEDWQYDHPPAVKIQPDTLSAIIMRMSQLSDNPMLRRVLGSPGGINVRQLIQENKIFLVNLKQNEPEAIVGSIIAAKIQHAIFARLKMDDVNLCSPYYLYIDECNKVLGFAEDRFDDILMQARKCKLCLTMANPIPKKLPAKIQDSLTTIGNLILFNLDQADASVFKSKLLPYKTDDLVNLPKFRAFLRTDNQVHRVKTGEFLAPLRNNHAKYAKDNTMRQYKPESAQDGQPDPENDDPPEENRPPHDIPHDRREYRRDRR